MNIDELQAGRGTDVLVAEKVMKWTPLGKGWWKTQDDERMTLSVFSPSTDIAQAWWVVEKMKDDENIFCIFADLVADECGALDYFPDGVYTILLKNLTPLTICRAALKAVQENL